MTYEGHLVALFFSNAVFNYSFIHYRRHSNLVEIDHIILIQQFGEYFAISWETARSLEVIYLKVIKEEGKLPLLLLLPHLQYHQQLFLQRNTTYLVFILKYHFTSLIGSFCFKECHLHFKIIPFIWISHESSSQNSSQCEHYSNLF